MVTDRQLRGKPMMKNEATKAAKLLASRTDRTEVVGSSATGGLSLTAYWIDGGQRMFHSLSEVRDYIADRDFASEQFHKRMIRDRAMGF